MTLQIESFDDELLYLIKLKEETKKVESIIKKENLYNVTDNSNDTLLHAAAKYDNFEIAKYLIDAGSSIDFQNDHGQTPLMFAMDNNCENIIEILIEAGANIELLDNSGNSALQRIGKANWVSEKLLKLCIENTKIYSFDKEELAKKLFEAEWPLPKIMLFKDAVLTKFLLQEGYSTKINESDYFNETALLIAIKRVDVENVKILLEYKANVNIVDSRKRKPLSYVYINDDYPDERFSMFKMLLGRGAELTNSLIHPEYNNILRFGNREIIKLILKSHMVQSDDFDEVEAVWALIFNEDQDAIEELRRKYFFVNLPYKDKWTLLMTAARNRKFKAVEVIFEALTEFDAAGEKESAALLASFIHQIIPCGSEEQYKHCVQSFLERGVNVQLKVHYLYTYYTTVFELVFDKKYFLLCKLLISRLALVESQGTRITESTKDRIKSHEQMKSYFESSKQRLKMEIYQSTTLFNLLTASDKTLERYVCNDELLSKIENFDYVLSEYYYFHTILQNRIMKAVSVATLKKKAGRIICKIMGTNYDRFPLVADKIINYLQLQDMQNLIKSAP